MKMASDWLRRERKLSEPAESLIQGADVDLFNAVEKAMLVLSRPHHCCYQAANPP